jgi:hypothetical protein
MLRNDVNSNFEANYKLEINILLYKYYLITALQTTFLVILSSLAQCAVQSPILYRQCMAR